MRIFFQTHWQGIQFASFATLSSKHLAGAEFYAAFYRELFRRYTTMESLPDSWLQDKRRCAQFIGKQVAGQEKVLAVGCGLGVIEHFLAREKPGLELSVHEVTGSAWQWLGPMIPHERKFIGWIPGCLPRQQKFDIIYLCAVDYVLDTPELIAMLASLRPYLSDRGRCLLISASFLDHRNGMAGKLKTTLRWLKAEFQAGLEYLRLYSRGQFWGWLRSADEYRELMAAAGYQDLTEGFIHPRNRQHYWICGSKSTPASP